MIRHMKVIVAYILLIAADIALKAGGLKGVYRVLAYIHLFRIGTGNPSGSPAIYYASVDDAARFYYKTVRCLQRSTAAVCLLRILRMYGVPATLVLGMCHI